MAVYGGFGTRQQESNYATLTESLIDSMQSFIISSYKNETPKQDFTSSCKKTLIKMNQLEEHKHYPPKFTSSCQDLIEAINAPLTVRSTSRNYNEITRQETPKFCLNKAVEKSLTPIASPNKLDLQRGLTGLPPINMINKELQLKGIV